MYPSNSFRNVVGGAIYCPVNDRCLVASACNPAGGRYQPVVCQRLNLERGALIWCNTSEKAECVFIIRSGVVALINFSEDGGESILGFLSEGQAFGITGLFAKETQPFLARAFTDVKLCQLSIAKLEKLIKTDSEVAKRVICSLSDSFWWVVQQIKFRDNLRARDRILISLQQLAEKLDQGQGEVELPLTHDDLANLVGVNRVTATRVLHELEEKGFVELGHRSLKVFLAIRIEPQDLPWNLFDDEPVPENVTA